MDISITQEATRIRFAIKGRIDEAGAEEMKSRFMGMNRSGIQEVVFDFASVEHIGSAGIGKLLLFFKEMAVAGGTISVENPSHHIHDLFRVLKLDTIFAIRK